MRRAEAQSGDRAERSLRAAMFQAGRGAGDGLGRAREGVGALPGPAASTRREGREDARGAGWRLDRASMTSSPPSPTEAAGLERRGAGRGPAGSGSRVPPGRWAGEAPPPLGDSVRCPRVPGSRVGAHLLLQPLISPLALRCCGGLLSPRIFLAPESQNLQRLLSSCKHADSLKQCLVLTNVHLIFSG